MTELFNYFALPPDHDDFCDAALRLSAEASTADPLALDSLAGRGLTDIDQIFVKFFIAFKQYEQRLQEWTTRNINAVKAESTVISQ